MPSEFLCGCHIKKWCWFLQFVQVVLAMAVIVFLIAFLALKAPDAGLPIEYTVSLCVQLVLFVVWLVLAYCLGHALKKNEPLAMRPHLIWTLILTVTVIFHGVLMILRNVTELAEFYAALAILLTFMLVAEYRCYKWLFVYQHLHYFLIN